MYDVMFGIGFLLIIFLLMPDIIAGLKRLYKERKDKKQARPSAASASEEIVNEVVDK